LQYARRVFSTTALVLAIHHVVAVSDRRCDSGITHASTDWRCRRSSKNTKPAWPPPVIQRFDLCFGSLTVQAPFCAMVCCRCSTDQQCRVGCHGRRHITHGTASSCTIDSRPLTGGPDPVCQQSQHSLPCLLWRPWTNSVIE
jgi:hypothetical protein